MTLAFVGGTHRTVPLALRERLAFSAEQAAEALIRFRERFPGRECVLLSTCNRVEFYAAGERAAVPPPPDQLVSFLAECRGIDVTLLSSVLAGERDEAADGREQQGRSVADLQQQLSSQAEALTEAREEADLTLLQLHCTCQRGATSSRPSMFQRLL